MTKRIKIVGGKAPKVRITSKLAENIDPNEVGSALGAGTVTKAKARQRKPVLTPGNPPESPPGMRRVTVNTLGDGFQSIDAWVFGEWAAHVGLGDRRKMWDVTYLPSGMNITSGRSGKSPDARLNEEQAKRLADWLNCHINREDLYDWSNVSAEVSGLVYQGMQMVSKSVADWMAENGLA